ncbi:MAG: hypothetical protein QM528_07835 [Phycisphaerales bacterium]|nr:hypothetical protein [Phycisphaerales bacterium]
MMAKLRKDLGLLITRHDLKKKELGVLYGGYIACGEGIAFCGAYCYLPSGLTRCCYQGGTGYFDDGVLGCYEDRRGCTVDTSFQPYPTAKCRCSATNEPNGHWCA